MCCIKRISNFILNELYSIHPNIFFVFGIRSLNEHECICITIIRFVIWQLISVGVFFESSVLCISIYIHVVSMYMYWFCPVSVACCVFCVSCMDFFFCVYQNTVITRNLLWLFWKSVYTWSENKICSLTYFGHVK